MSGVWVFKDGLVRRVENPGQDDEWSSAGGGGGGRRKVLVHVPIGEVVTSYEVLEWRLRELGWERYLNDPAPPCTSVPRDFARFRLVHMYDIVVKTRNVFEVRDAAN
ncbi:hypothetical protein C2845_PM11G03420 [Panicum miliaceum]|uniref:Flowering-promoting factor 1-like protein 3 n=1 Tax=Panicum miliaceum TaxID=4540 RepID=A0A3L6RUM5_PANMI|nr:hypothetical protein C2845_PM11G03420 [Panicum miliaceum]